MKYCCLAVSLCLLLGCSDRAVDSAIFERFDGTWGATLADSTGGCGGNTHRIRFNEQRTKAYFDFKYVVATDVDSEEIQQTVYSIASYDHHSIIMSIDGDTHTDADGNPVIWELIPIDQHSYTWHRMDWKPGQYTQPFACCVKDEDPLSKKGKAKYAEAD